MFGDRSAEMLLHRAITPSAYARQLLDGLGLTALQPADDRRAAGLLWAQSGAMWLSGHAEDAPRACPAPLAACAQGAWLALAALQPARCDPGFDAFRLLGERAALTGLSRRGRVSAGGACHLLDTRDGALALNLARDDDVDLLPAWLEQPVEGLQQAAVLLLQRDRAALVERARLLGLAAAEVEAPRLSDQWFRAQRLGVPVQRSPSSVPLVIDLSALWAGPLCAQLLAQCGARVIKVESLSRPDGARRGPVDFYDLLNGDKESLALDLRGAEGRAKLRALLLQADIVIESARPRALEQMGIRADELLAARPGLVWLGITGYGRRAPMRDWIAYGDDAGVAAGLSWLMGGDRGDPVFCGDAIADPLTGLHAALLAYATWRDGGGMLLDIALREVVAHCVGAGSVSDAIEFAAAVSPPVARAATRRAATLGADTARLLREFG